MRRFNKGLSVAMLVGAACGTGGEPATGGNGGDVPACGPASCTGCCFNDSCQPGSTAAACGKNGAACFACDQGQICRVEQTCGVDPESRWKVRPVAAEIKPSNNGTSWDGDGSAPDVVVSTLCPGSATVAKTEERQSYAPAFTSGGCTAKASALLAEPFGFTVDDIDAIADDSITGRLIYQAVEADFVSGGVALGGADGLASIRFALERQ